MRQHSFQGRTEGVRSHGGTIFRLPCKGSLYRAMQMGVGHMVVVCAYYHVRQYSFQGRTEGVRSHGGTIFRPPCEGILI